MRQRGWQFMRFAQIVGILTILAVPLPCARGQEEAPSPSPGEEEPSLSDDTPRFSTEEGEEPDLDESRLITRLLHLDKCGLTFEGTLLYDVTSNFMGGRKPGYTRGQNLLNLGIVADLEKMCGVEKGTVFLLFQSHRGNNAHAYAGDEQFFDQLDAVPYPDRGQLSEAWWQQYFFDDKLRLKIGKVDANEEFAYVTNGLDFIHGAFGNAPTIFLLPTYPDPATGINVFLYPNEKYYAGFGLYDGSFSRGVATGRRGPETFFEAPATYFLIGELGRNYKFGKNELEGRIAVGYWLSTGKFLDYSRLETAFLRRGDQTVRIPEQIFEPTHGTGGWYVVWDHPFWKENPEDKEDKQGIAGFYQFGSADPRITIFETYHGIGVTWTGFQQSRDEDVIGFGIAYSGFSDDPRAVNIRREPYRIEPIPGNEIAYQWFYKRKAGKFLTLQPNLTYVHDPGQDRAYKDVIALTMRFIVDF
ncbi:MAG: carbohydrate porin [Planctomycetota bacterium]